MGQWAELDLRRVSAHQERLNVPTDQTNTSHLTSDPKSIFKLRFEAFLSQFRPQRCTSLFDNTDTMKALKMDETRRPFETKEFYNEGH